MANVKKTNKPEETENELSPDEQFDAFLKLHPTVHYNFRQEEGYTISSGSLTLDIKMGGGLRPGIVRFSGTSEGGKTSCALSFAKNFIESVENSFVFYIKAEGRLPEQILERAGLEEGKKFRVFHCNEYEGVVAMIEHHIRNNPRRIKYLFIIDSMDALNLQKDLNRGTLQDKKKDDKADGGEKKPEEQGNQGPAGGATICSNFFRRMALPLSTMGHVCICVSQVRANIKIGYTQTKGTNDSITTSSGGNAIIHYSDWILEFQKRNNDDFIRKDDEKKGEIIGHYCKIIFRKSPNEKSQCDISYPIKYGRIGGKSVWIEKEVADLLVTFGYVQKTGAWFTFLPEIVEKVKKETGLELQDKFQGFDNLSAYFENNEVLSRFFYDELKAGLKEKIE